MQKMTVEGGEIGPVHHESSLYHYFHCWQFVFPVSQMTLSVDGYTNGCNGPLFLVWCKAATQWVLLTHNDLNRLARFGLVDTF